MSAPSCCFLNRLRGFTGQGKGLRLSRARAQLTMLVLKHRSPGGRHGAPVLWGKFSSSSSPADLTAL